MHWEQWEIFTVNIYSLGIPIFTKKVFVPDVKYLQSWSCEIFTVASHPHHRPAGQRIMPRLLQC